MLSLPDCINPSAEIPYLCYQCVNLLQGFFEAGWWYLKYGSRVREGAPRGGSAKHHHLGPRTRVRYSGPNIAQWLPPQSYVCIRTIRSSREDVAAGFG